MFTYGQVYLISLSFVLLCIADVSSTSRQDSPPGKTLQLADGSDTGKNFIVTIFN